MMFHPIKAKYRFNGPVRRGRCDSTSLLAAGSVVVAATMVLILFMLGRRSDGGGSARPLTLFCAAALRQPVEQIVAAYERECGVQVRVQYGGSNTLLGAIEVGRMGDLFLVAEEMYADLARQKGLAQEVIPVAVQRPVIAVRKGNPRRIGGIDDLVRADVRLGLANPEQAAIGHLTKELLGPGGRWRDLEREVTQRGVFKPTVPDLANDLKLGTVDASILWDATVRQYPELEAVRSKELERGTARIVVSVLTTAKSPSAALRFARFLAARDRGLSVFASTGYEAVEGDLWAATPQLTFFVGVVARPAVEETIWAFEEHEGVVVNTVYNGCGILTTQMLASRDRKQSGFPDLYLPGDHCFLEPVKDYFQEEVELSETDITMIVQKGNSKGIRVLKDLTREGIRVAVGHPQQCTVGFLTRDMLEKEGMRESVMKNVVAQMPTAAMLVPAVTTGACDVALGWNTHVLKDSGRRDTVRIDSKYTMGVQLLAIARSSDHKELARRLFRTILTSQSRFESAGFRWRMPSPPAASRPASDDRSNGSMPKRVRPWDNTVFAALDKPEIARRGEGATW
jgi:ABC-type molybdate transport system substrate-binding protein